MATRKQHFVEFRSPGTFYDEATQKPIESWNVPTAARMAADIVERHGARPYGFVFITKIVADAIDDGEGGKLEVEPKTVATSGVHYLDGVTKRYDEIAGSENRTLLANMRGNGWPIVCETTNGYRHTGIFEEADFVVSAHGVVLSYGNNPANVEYRQKMLKAWASR